MKRNWLCGAVGAAFSLTLFVGNPVIAADKVTPQPFPEFTAKRVKPPAKYTAKRITVQIAPPPAVAPIVSAPAPQVAGVTAGTLQDKAPGRSKGAGRYGWFWQAVSPGLEQTGPSRLEPALQHLAAAPAAQAVATPRLQSLQEIARAHGREILMASVNAQVSPAFILAVISVESGGRADAVSGAGAQGLMQLIPATAERFDVGDAFDPAENIRGGAEYLSWLLAKFEGDPILALAGYNAGENTVTGKGGVPDYAETRDYIPKVLAAYQVARGLCLSPPEMVTDGCVFVGM